MAETPKKDWKLKDVISKYPVQYLNSSAEFQAWHISFRQMVASYNMIHVLMYTIPASHQASTKARIDKLASGEKKVKAEPLVEEDEAKAVLLPSVIDLTEEAPLKRVSRSDEDMIYMKSMGITPAMDDFFASTTSFINVRTGTPDTDRESFYRQEIWMWMEKALSLGTFKWLVKSISVTFDIHALWQAIHKHAAEVSWISFSMDYRKIFTMTPSDTGDIFQYLTEVRAQIKKVEDEGQQLGLTTKIPPLIENALLLIAAWEAVPKNHYGLHYG